MNNTAWYCHETWSRVVDLEKEVHELKKALAEVKEMLKESKEMLKAIQHDVRDVGGPL